MNSSRVVALFSIALLLSMTAAAQGTFAHFAAGPYWETSYTLVNTSTTGQAVAQISFFGDDGKPLAIQVAERIKAAVQTLTIPAGGSVALTLDSEGADLQGWAKLESASSGTPIRGQALFRHHQPGVPEAEGVVPLDLGSAPSMCIIPYPNPTSSGTIILPFDNTANTYVTAIAIVNISSSDRVIDLEYADANHKILFTDHISLTALHHTAFLATDRSQALANTNGVLRVKAGPQDVSVLAFLYRVTTGTFTTVIPNTN